MSGTKPEHAKVLTDCARVLAETRLYIADIQDTGDKEAIAGAVNILRMVDAALKVYRLTDVAIALAKSRLCVADFHCNGDEEARARAGNILRMADAALEDYRKWASETKAPPLICDARQGSPTNPIAA